MHVAHAHGEAKFWLTPQVALANNTGLSDTQLRHNGLLVANAQQIAAARRMLHADQRQR